MQCPKCGAENPDGVQICSKCALVLTESAAEQPKPKVKTSKMAIGSALLAGLAVALSIFVDPALAFLAASLGIFTAITSIVKIRKSKGKLIGKSFAIVGIIFPLVHVLLLSYWRIDAAPVPNDYTISDIRSAPPQYSQSYELLNDLADVDSDLPDAPAIGLSERDVKNLEEINKVFKESDYSKISAVLKANTDSIYHAWENAQKGRDVISKLNTFQEIVDLTEPDLEADIKFLRNLRRLVYLYQAYVYLQAEQGNYQDAINELIKFDSVFRKLSVNARSMIVKLVCYAGLNIGINTANFIVNNPQTSQESLELLAEHFTPLTKEQVSLRNPVISEYLMCKNELSKIFRENKLKYSSFSPLKLNSALRLYKNFCDRWIAVEENRAETEELTVWPTMYPKLSVTIDSDGRFPWYYKAYNPIGSLLIGIMIPALDRVFQIKTKLQIHSDLLQIVLNKRLGKEVSLKARAYGDEYIIDVENKKIFSPGPDGEPNTEDDIKLIINPEALRLLSK